MTEVRRKSIEVGLIRCKSLSFDIHEEILLRSEVTDLIRCKSVCKSWNSLISSDRFVKSHLQRSRSNGIGDKRIEIHISLDHCELVGSSNGLVCLIIKPNDYLFVNPATREVKQLASIPDEQDYKDFNVFAHGFGYDSSIDDFKVVIGYMRLPHDYLKFKVLLKTNIWRSVHIDYDSFIDYGFSCNEAFYSLQYDGILYNGAIYWVYPRTFDGDVSVIVSFDLSKEIFQTIPLPILGIHWTLGTMKDRLCVFINLEEDVENEIWVMRNNQVSWERKLLFLPDTNNTTILRCDSDINLLSGNIHIWLIEEGSGAPVLVRSIDHPLSPPLLHDHIRLYTYLECNDYKYDQHVFLKSLVSPHRGTSKIKKQSHVSSDHNCNGRRVERKRRERETQSRVFHSSKGGRTKSKRQRHVYSDSDGDGIRVEMNSKERESRVFQSSDKGRANIKRQSHVSSDYNGNGRRVERETESRVFHSSKGGRAKSKRQRHVYSDSEGEGGRAKRKRQRHVYSDSDGEGRTVERNSKKRESRVFHSSDKGRANIKRQSHLSSDYNGNRRRAETKRESLVFHSSKGGRGESKRKRHVYSDSDGDGMRVERNRRERESCVSWFQQRES